jgi:hypothetical protein
MRTKVPIKKSNLKVILVKSKISPIEKLRKKNQEVYQ